MKTLFDKCLLILFCFFQLLIVPVDQWFLFGFFSTIIFTCLNFYINNRRFTAAAMIFLCALSCFSPGFLVFLCLSMYDGAFFLPVAFWPLVLVPLAVSIEKLPTLGLLFNALCCLLALYLKYQTVQGIALEERLKKTRDDSTELNMLLKEKNKTLREKQDYEIYAATLKERNRIAREIHDNVGHLLSRSILMLGALKTVNKQEPLVSPLAQLEDTLSSAMGNIRQSVHDIHDDSISLRQGTESILKDFSFCKVAFTYDMSLEVPRDIKYCFLAVTKEALANIMKHSNGDQATIIMREHPALYQLIIEDNGTCTAQQGTPGIGLTNMKERVRALQGTISIQKEPGFSIFISIPKAEEEANERIAH